MSPPPFFRGQDGATITNMLQRELNLQFCGATGRNQPKIPVLVYQVPCLVYEGRQATSEQDKLELLP